MSAGTTDAILLESLRKGESTAFEALYRQYFNMVKYLVTCNNGDADNASDIFQEGMIVLYEKVREGKLELTASLKTYLYSICRNLWLKELRKKKPQAKLEDFEQFIPVEEETDEKEVTERQLLIVGECMDELGEPCKSLLTKFYYEKKSMEQIAREMGYTNADNAKNKKYKCLQRLKKLALEKAGKE